MRLAKERTMQGRAFHSSALHTEGSLSKVEETLLCSTDLENRKLCICVFGRRVQSHFSPACKNHQAGIFKVLPRAGDFQLLVLTVSSFLNPAQCLGTVADHFVLRESI